MGLPDASRNVTAPEARFRRTVSFAVVMVARLPVVCKRQAGIAPWRGKTARLWRSKKDRSLEYATRMMLSARTCNLRNPLPIGSKIPSSCFSGTAARPNAAWTKINTPAPSRTLRKYRLMFSPRSYRAWYLTSCARSMSLFEGSQIPQNRGRKLAAVFGGQAANASGVGPQTSERAGAVRQVTGSHPLVGLDGFP